MPDQHPTPHGPRWTDPPAADEPAKPNPVRVQGASILAGLVALQTLGLFAVVFRAGGITQQVQAHDRDIIEINKALTTLGQIGAAAIEGNIGDRTAIQDIRARLASIEGRRQ